MIKSELQALKAMLKNVSEIDKGNQIQMSQLEDADLQAVVGGMRPPTACKSAGSWDDCDEL